MKTLAEKIKSLLIDPELQFRFIVPLIILITLESVFVGRAFVHLILLTWDWQRPHLIWDFFWRLSLLLLILIVVNGLFGLYFSSKIARPANKLKKGLDSLKDGNLTTYIDHKPGDSLQDVTVAFNDFARVMERLESRDHKLAKEVMSDLEKCANAKKEDLPKMLVAARSKLSIISAHFFKGEK